MIHRHHISRAWRLITAKVTADPHAERELRREVGEGTYDWYALANALADVIATEMHAQLEHGQFGDACLTADDLLEWLHYMAAGDDEGAA